MKSWLPDLVAIAGGASFVAGAWWVNPAVGLVALGLSLLVLAIILGWAEAKRPRTPGGNP